jgi:hypothetical protein
VIVPRPSVLVSLAEQVLLSMIRKEAALDLHSPFSTSHTPVRHADWPLASPFLTFLPFASFELWPQKWGRFFCVHVTNCTNSGAISHFCPNLVKPLDRLNCP